MSDKTLTVRTTHRYRHATETVFDAWLNPEIAGKFLFATPAGTMMKAQIDPRVGGAFVFVDRREGVDFEHVGEYLEIDRPRRLVFFFRVPAFSDLASVVIIEIVQAEGGCELTLTHEGVLPDYAEGTKGGWTMILGKLGDVLG